MKRTTIHVSEDRDLPDAGGGRCCIGAAVYGPGRCTCWEPIQDRPQEPPQEGPTAIRSAMCSDCAYRSGSPERESGRLENLGGRFYCHQGMVRGTGYRHPSGVEIEAEGYAPAVTRAGVYLADGTPAPLCAGWARREGLR